MTPVKNFIQEFVENEDGLTTLEYVALAFGILLTAIVAVRLLGGSIKNRFNKLNDEMQKSN